MTDEETIRVYNAKVADYAKLTQRDKIDPDLIRFMGYLPKGGQVLDLGCGPATASAIMRDHGFSLDPVDASPEMVRFANEKHNIFARIATFEEIDCAAIYDGIWANFSLLHSKRAAMPGHLLRIKLALKPGGTFHLGVKLGEGEERDVLGRFYTYYSQDEIEVMLETSGFAIIDRSYGDEPGLSGITAPWITILAKATLGPAPKLPIATRK